MSPRLYLLLGISILASSLIGHLADDPNVRMVLSHIPIFAGFMAIGHAIQRVCVTSASAQP